MTIISKDGIDGITVQVLVDEKGNRKFRHTQDVGDILKHAEEMRKRSKENWNANKNTKHVAGIPEVLYQEMQRKGITEDPKEFKRYIEKYIPEYKYTRKRI